MKKIYILLFVFLEILANSLTAQTYSLSTTKVITDGFVYKKYTTTTPWVIHVLEVDLGNPAVKLQAVKSNDTIGGPAQTVKVQAANHDKNSSYHNIVGAVNGDLFYDGTSNPVNLMVSDGQVFMNRFLNPKRTIFGISDTNVPFISLPNEVYKVNKNGIETTINKVNNNRGVNELVLFNQFNGGSTGTNNLGTEVKLALNSGQVWKANGTVQCTVLAKETSIGNMKFTSGQAVLSGHGTAATYLNGYSIGDVVTLQLNIDSLASNVNQIIGGYVRLVNNGVNTAEQSLYDEGGDSGQNIRNPRTGLGLSKDKRTLYMVVVDGRTTESAGMTFNEFGSLFLYLGAYNAINLDGGGSSTLIANNTVMNVPIDGGVAGQERSVASALLAWSNTCLFDDFESNEGHFTTSPTYDSQYTIGIASTSTLDRVTTTAFSGSASECAVLYDNTSSSSAWTVRLLSGQGLPANNYSIASTGTVSVWLKTSTAQPGATIQLWFDDTDGAEQTPGLAIVNDGQWHQYNFDLNYSSGGTAITGNGILDGATVSIDAIVLKQPNTASQWTVYFDEIKHDKNGSGTKVTGQNLSYDDFEAGEGHFNQAPTYTAGTQYTVGISTASTMDRVTTEKYRGMASEKAVLYDDVSVTKDWTVRLLSGSGMPSNNTPLISDGIVSVWLKTSTAQPGATIQLWFDDSDGAEASPSLTIINDGQWHKYEFDLNYTNGTAITTGNGKLDGTTVTLDAIVLKQPNTSSTWTVYFDDVMYYSTGSGTEVFGMGLNDNRIPQETKKEKYLSNGNNWEPYIYPNPNNGIFTIDLKEDQTYKVQIFSIAGTKVFDQVFNGGSQTINVSQLPAALYFLHIKGAEVTKTFKIFIKK